MPSETAGLTVSQIQDVEEFLHLFADVEAALKKRLGRKAGDRAAIKSMIDEYLEQNSYWADSASRLRHLADIRNVLTHQRSSTSGYPIAVAPNSLRALRETKEHLLKPESVAKRFKRRVTTVGSEDALASVLSLAFDNGFSQFPVLTGGRFVGLITENEVARWLGRRIKTHSAEVNLAAVTVRSVIREKDPAWTGISIFRFEKLDSPVEEVISHFSAQPALEAVLLTFSGTNKTSIEGIITQWDAARFSP